MQQVPALRAVHVSRTFGQHRALKHVDLEVGQGEAVALLGPSGSGKSTLLRILGGLLPMDTESGLVNVLGNPMQRNGRIIGSRSTRRRIAFVFQQYNLVGRLSLFKNVLIGRLPHIPLWRGLIHWFPSKDRQLAMEALHSVGLSAFAKQRADTLSGGQKQRGAIARAIAQGAEIILADEPIASLDPESSRSVMDNLTSQCRERGVTLLVSLHQVEYARKYCQRIVTLRDGKVVFNGAPKDLDTEQLKACYGSRVTELTSPNLPQDETPDLTYVASET